MEVYDYVKIKETGELGTIIILVGAPTREVYVELHDGAGANYVYFTMWDENTERVQIRTLNLFTLDELEKPVGYNLPNL